MALGTLPGEQELLKASLGHHFVLPINLEISIQLGERVPLTKFTQEEAGPKELIFMSG